jgi:hypothetical protein
MLRIEHPSAHVISASGIGAIQHPDLDIVFGGGFEHEPERGNVGVETRAHILHIENEQVDAFEHGGRWFTCRAIEAEDGEPGRGVDTIRDFLTGAVIASKAVLRGEQGFDGNAERAQGIEHVRAVDPCGGVHHQADVSARQLRKMALDEEVGPDLNPLLHGFSGTDSGFRG